jgi:hypothetical protein
MWMSRKFFLLFGIFSLKTENHLLGKKILQKILRRAFLICYFLGCAAGILKKAGCISVLRASRAEPLKVRFSPIRGTRIPRRR